MNRQSFFKVIAVTFLIGLCAPVALAQSKDRAQIKKEIDALYQQIKEKEAELLAPSQAARQAYAEFLKQPETGLVRLLPRERYDNKLSIRGGGAYYSFIRLTHEYGYGSDIELQNNSFSVGFAGADFGFLLNLGDIPIEEVTTETKGIKYLADFAPPTNEPEARIQQHRAWDFNADGINYKNRVPAKVGNTYVVRSVDYDDSDCLVAFRVVDEDFDESMTIVWKMLNKFPKPILARAQQ